MPSSFDQHQAEQDRKRFLMWLWVAVITVAIVIGWVFTFRAAARRVLSAQPTTPATGWSASGGSQPALEDFQKQLQKSMDEFKKTWEATKN